MASLQTLRNKGGIIVAVVIGFALLAFVLGDLLTSGSRLFGSDQNNVGEINGNKISYQEFSSEMNYLTEIRKITNGGQESSTDESNEVIRNQTWEMFIRQYAIQPNLDKLGITVGTQEMKQLIGGAHTSPIILQMFANPQTGMLDDQYLKSFISNINADPSGRMQMFWGYLQQEISSQAQMNKLGNILNKAAYVTSFEAQQMQKLESTNYSVRFVAKPYSSIADSTINVSSAEAKAFYDKYPNAFQTEQSRTIDYVIFDAIPSAVDRTSAEKYMTDLAEEFRKSATPMQFATLNSQSAMDTRYYKEGEISGELGKFAFESTTDQIYGPELNGEQYTLARISDVKIIPDSVNFSHIAFQINEKAKADSILKVIRKNNNFVAMAKEYSQDKASAEKGGEMGTYDPQTMPEVFSTPILKTKKGDIILIETPQSVHIIKINDTKGDSKKVQLAQIKYTIEPSSDTRAQTFNQATAFVTSAKKDFNKALTEQSLVKRTTTVTPNDRTVASIPQSRELARWTYNSSPNEVSNVMEFGDSFVIATLTTVTEQGKLAFESVEPQIKTLLAQHKKAEMIAQQVTGVASVDDLAAKLAVNVIESQDVSFNTYVVPEIGLDPAFAGGICGMNASQISKPIIGRLGVYVAQITGSIENPVALDVVKARMHAEVQQRAFISAYQSFMNLMNIKDFRYRFY